jgi:hypothetical protein
MMLRKGLVRALAVCVLLLGGGGYYLVERWTNPQVVRELALDSLGKCLPGMDVRLASAEVRLLGGVTLYDLRCSFHEGDEAEGFVVLPETILYPDKEKLTRGKLALRKLVIKRPSLTVVRRANGALNLEQLKPLANAGEGMELPLVEIEDATLTLYDLMAGAPPLQLNRVHLELTPLDNSRYRLTGGGHIDLLGPCQCHGQINTSTGESTLNLALSELILSDEHFRRVIIYYPQWKRLNVDLAGVLSASASVTYFPAQATPLSCRFSGTLRQGRVAHPDLPAMATDLEGSFALAGQVLTLERVRGRFLGGAFEMRGTATAAGDVAAEMQAQHWLVTPDLYERLPGAFRRLCREYQPRGRLSASGRLTYVAGNLGLSYEAHPEGMSILFEDLPYPVADVRGNIVYDEPAGNLAPACGPTMN